ncbi:MAG: hypothetical protein QG622_3639, partial [Actinomycetota bacterium]|nr:hypothetical protein [Actinomycetota bacterium]
RYDVLISPHDRAPGAPRPVSWPVPRRHPDGGQPGAYANDPVDGRRCRALVPALRRFLADRLPPYLVPSVVIPVDVLPTTAHGKVDRARLSLPAGDDPLGEEGFVAPRTALERTLAGFWGDALGNDRVGVRDDFFALGGHSLIAASVVARIERECEVRVSLRRFFENPTVEESARLVERLRSGEGASPAGLTVPGLRAEATLDPSVRPRAPGARSATGRVLLTGATGFLGGFLLQELMTRTSFHVEVLVRGTTDAAAARERVLRSAARWGIRDDGWSGRVTAVPGDLSRPFLGLEPRRFERLADDTDAIYHNAAEVDLVRPYRALRATNVTGTVEILRLATWRGCRPVHYVSTLAAVSLMRPSHPWTEGPLDVDGLDPDLLAGAPVGYSVSKFVAERILAEAGTRGIPVTVLRPTSITGHSRTGAANTADFLHAVLRESLLAGCLPDDVRLDLVPVDFASAAVVEISLAPIAGGYFHLASPEPMGIDGVVAWAASRGFTVEPVDRRTWLRRMVVRVRDGESSLGVFSGLVGELLEYPGLHRFMQARIERPATVNTEHALAGTGLVCPPVDRALLDTYLDHLVRTGFLDAAPGDPAR